MIRQFIVSTVTGFALVCGVAAQAEQAPAKQEAPAASAESVGQSGMLAFVDPETGELVSSPVTEEQKQFAERAGNDLNFSDEGLVQQVMPDGSVMVDLQGRYQMSMVVDVQADGSLRARCTDDAHTALGAHEHELNVGSTPTAAERDVQ